MSVDPAARATDQEGYDADDVIYFADAPEGSHLGNFCDQLLAFPLQEEFGRDRSGRYRIDSDLSLTELICQNPRKTFDARL